MLKILIFVSALLATTNGFTQEAYRDSWQHLDLQADNIFGISKYKADREILGNTVSEKVIVAIIDGGIDTNHFALHDMLWINKAEIPNNGIDDDKNGYIDDVHGWNFLGSSNGSFQFDNSDFVRQLRAELTKDKDSEHSIFLQLQLEQQRDLTNAKLTAIQNDRLILEAILNNIGRNNVTIESLKNYVYKDGNEERGLINLVNAFRKNPDVKNYEHNLDLQLNFYDEQLKYWQNLNYNPRKGKEFEKPYYGNGDIQGPLTDHATHVAGIIAGKCDSTRCIGVAKNVELMILRTVPTGDYLDSEMAAAIRYAVDNGAKIINISITKNGSTNRTLIDDAVKYAGEKDVMIIHACGNQGKKIDVGLYPRREYQDGGKSSAWIEVGASTMKDDLSLLFPTSNYGKAVTDVFAPGANIISCAPGNGYVALSGTSMATPVVSGIAATLRSRYPKLNAVEVTDIISKSVVKVDHDVLTNSGKLPFRETCSSGGVVNLVNALKLAAQYNIK